MTHKYTSYVPSPSSVGFAAFDYMFPTTRCSNFHDARKIELMTHTSPTIKALINKRGRIFHAKRKFLLSLQRHCGASAHTRIIRIYFGSGESPFIPRCIERCVYVCIVYSSPDQTASRRKSANSNRQNTKLHVVDWKSFYITHK